MRLIVDSCEICFALRVRVRIALHPAHRMCLQRSSVCRAVARLALACVGPTESWLRFGTVWD